MEVPVGTKKKPVKSKPRNVVKAATAGGASAVKEETVSPDGLPGPAASAAVVADVLLDKSRMEPDEKVARRKNEEKWGKDLWKAGWVAFPAVIIERQRPMSLDHTDLAILLLLANYWWSKDEHPRPAVSTMATILGVHSRTVQRHLNKLVAQGCLAKHLRPRPDGDNDTNLYDFGPLIKLATEHAKEVLAQREAARKEKLRRATRGRPRAPSTGEGGHHA